MTEINNLTDTAVLGEATMKNGDFLTFDPLPSNKYSLFIPSLPNVQFFLQSFTLPSVSVKEISVSTPYLDYAQIGEKMNFEPFNVTFLVDKYTRNWTSVYNWMKAMTVNGSNVDKTEDMVLLIDGKDFVRFVNAWPSVLSGFVLDTTLSDTIYVKSSTSFQYDYFNIVSQFATSDSSY